MPKLPRFLDRSDPLEKNIERAVCDYAKSLGVATYKFTSPARRSVPDRIFIAPGGVIYFVEFKRRGQKATGAQRIEIARLRALGCTVSVVDNVVDGKELVDLLR